MPRNKYEVNIGGNIREELPKTISVISLPNGDDKKKAVSFEDALEEIGELSERDLVKLQKLKVHPIL